jgi:hypothetical protein
VESQLILRPFFLGGGGLTTPLLKSMNLFISPNFFLLRSNIARLCHALIEQKRNEVAMIARDGRLVSKQPNKLRTCSLGCLSVTYGAVYVVWFDEFLEARLVESLIDLILFVCLSVSENSCQTADASMLPHCCLH